MPIDIVVGGQAGDEGKGKIAAFLASREKYSCCVRVGGPNAGHTIHFKDKFYTLKTIPSGFVHPGAKLVLGAGTYVKLDWLLKEIELTGTGDRLYMDPHVMVVEERHTERERSNKHIMGDVGSVGTGLGEAVKDRIDRNEVKFAKDVPELSGYVTDVPELLNKCLEKGQNMLLEGTQGMKLSLLHGEYPFVTSRDTTASTFLGEAGLGPKYVRDVYAIFKPYVTRVGPGPIQNEITDKAVLKKYHTEGREVGSVSGRLRRIGSFEMAVAKKTVMINSANKIVITHIDMFDGNTHVKDVKAMTPEAKKFLDSLKELLETFPYPKLALISTGPGLEEVIDLR